ncbi:hypothetical protein [Moritella sp.]|uniref:AAA family ATPase n=1 Tax=Moritella sp. TaxID=78556 RepID=UPI001DD80DDA|nr:hypothetical protein [Moritella sp.]MCJ8350940.1 hypothetical protein [Moritella sp.]NQZ40803.1 hypothetical protein [Moritella sp.]
MNMSNQMADEHIENSNLRGRKITVVSAKGGAGTTSLLANIAWGLSQLQGTQVACADLDFMTGDLDLQFSVSTNNALLEMLQFPDRLEPVVYQRSGIKVNDDLYVFTAYAAGFEQNFWPDVASMQKVSRFCLQQATYLLWDVPAFCLRDKVGFDTLNSSDIRVVIVEPTLASIRSTNQLLAKLDALPSTRTLVVLNHTKPESSSLITAKDVATALDCKLDAEIPYAPADMRGGNSLGVLAINQKSRNAKALKKLVNLISGQAKIAKPSLFSWRKGA